MTAETTSYVLGLDMGAASIGWALIRLDKKGAPKGILRAGAHIFDAGVEGSIEEGKDQSRATARREARGARRQHWRRAWRRKKLLRTLQRNGLAPKGCTDTPEAVHEYMLKWDESLRRKWLQSGERVANHLLPYLLRKAALDNRLELHELGRAIYHLGQRRGFLSNRKAPKKNEDQGVVKQGINELHQRMLDAGARTLGEFLSGLDPEQERIRSRWTSRQMYVEELDAIWKCQAQHHSGLTQQIMEQISHALFDQRPLKSQKHLIGHCELMPERRCAPKAIRIYQRFRLLQAVNNLRVVQYQPTYSERPLTCEERKIVIAAQEVSGKVKFTTLRGKKYLNLPKGCTFNLEEGGEKELPGHKTDAQLAKIFGDKWEDLSELDKDRVVEDVMTFEKEDALAKRARNVWKLDKESAVKLAELQLEKDYARHCSMALNELVDVMEDGVPFATAKKDRFPETFETKEALDHLPPVLEVKPDLRNPAVCRSLTELRKLVNQIIRRYGKPETIRIELARELKKPRKIREQQATRNRQRQKQREEAKKRILKEMGNQNPGRRDIEKVLLAEECNWLCPYTGKSISMSSLLGDNPQFDIEHIFPFSRSLDNSFMNKTLCYHEENRTRKGQLTPFEAYSNDSKRWNEMLMRVHNFTGPIANIKYQRFCQEELDDDFIGRFLKDTQYMSRVAGEYLSLLYGGRWDDEHKLRIQVNTGGVTAYVRNIWNMNGILDDGGMKTREDHRHHAVDAIAIALSSPSTVKTLSDAAKRNTDKGHNLFVSIPEPWANFFQDARVAIESINVSSRPNHKLNGLLHAESNYSKPIPHSKGMHVHHIRKALSKLTLSEIKEGDAIVDPVVRELVQQAFEVSGETKPDKAFADPHGHPVLKTRDGRAIPIHKVRIRMKVKPWQVGCGAKIRWIGPKAGSNHHVVIVAELNAEDAPRKWEEYTVSRFDAIKRKSETGCVIKRDWGKGRLFVFSLMPGDFVLMQDNDGVEQLYRLSSISEGDNEFRLHSDARIKKESRKAKATVRVSAQGLNIRHAKKVNVSYLGEITPAND